MAGLAGLSGVVLLDSLSFLIAGALIALIQAPVRESSQPQEATIVRGIAPAWSAVWQEWLEGLRLVWARKTLATLFVLAGVQALCQGLFLVLFVVFVSRILGGSAAEIGWLRGVQAVGGLLGAVAVGMLGKQVPVTRLIGLGAIGFGLIELAIWNSPALIPGFWLSMLLFVVVGIPGASMGSGESTLLQTLVADAYRGRVSAAYGTSYSPLILGGMLLAGAGGDHWLMPLLNLQGCLYLLTGVFTLAMLPREDSQSQNRAYAAQPEAAI